MYFDNYGLIVQKDGDGGDTLQREGFWFEAVFLNTAVKRIIGMSDYPTALHYLRNCMGDFIRYHIQWTNPSDTSRDQLVSNIRAMGYYGFNVFLQKILQDIVKNFSRYPNGDIAFVQDYSRFARAFKAWWLYPICLIGDVFMLINSIVRCIKGRNYDDVGDDINHIGDLAQAQRILPTPISWLARKIYVSFRPSYAMVAIGIVKARGPGAIWALSWYFRAASGANTEFIEAWRPIVINF